MCVCVCVCVCLGIFSASRDSALRVVFYASRIHYTETNTRIDSLFPFGSGVVGGGGMEVRLQDEETFFDSIFKNQEKNSTTHPTADSVSPPRDSCAMPSAAAPRARWWRRPSCLSPSAVRRGALPPPRTDKREREPGYLTTMEQVPAQNNTV